MTAHFAPFLVWGDQILISKCRSVRWSCLHALVSLTCTGLKIVSNFSLGLRLILSRRFIFGCLYSFVPFTFAFFLTKRAYAALHLYVNNRYFASFSIPPLPLPFFSEVFVSASCLVLSPNVSFSHPHLMYFVNYCFKYMWTFYYRSVLCHCAYT